MSDLMSYLRELLPTISKEAGGLPSWVEIGVAQHEALSEKKPGLLYMVHSTAFMLIDDPLPKDTVRVHVGGQGVKVIDLSPPAKADTKEEENAR